MPTCDFIVPVYNCATILPRTLTALTTQEFSPSWSPRLIIIDGGSIDNSLSITRRTSMPATWQSPIILTQPSFSIAAARNHGLKHATADIIFFLGADILLRPSTLATHFSWHDSHPAIHYAALGMVKWNPTIKPTPFMEWMVHGGNQNNFDALLGSSTAPPAHFFYGSHLSLKKSFLGRDLFSSHFSSYGWEDLELGRRLYTKGLKLYPLLHAIGLHNHHYSTNNILRRQYQTGLSLSAYQQQHPHSPLIPNRSLFKHFRHHLFFFGGFSFLLSIILSFTASRWSTPRLFSIATAGKFWQGIYRAKQSQ
jgi:glycosyltransferase involved in cell wall biosynthesis